jgi:O-antigen ligase
MKNSERKSPMSDAAKIVIKRLTPDDKILIALWAPFYSALMNSTIVFMLQIESNHPGFLLFRDISILIIGLLFLYALPVVLKRATTFASIVVSLLIIILAVTFLIFPDNIPFLYKEGVLVYALFITLPCFIYAYCIKDMDKFYNYLEVYSTIVLVVSLFILVAMFVLSFGINNSYTMSLGYSAGLASIFYLHKILEKRQLKDILFFAIGFFLIISIGSRGPLLCLAVFILVYFLMNSLKQRITLGRLIGFTLTMLCLGLIIYTLGNQTLLIKINHLLSEFNINSRTLILLINDNLGQSSGREGIYSFLIEKIKEQPLLGYGIGSDRMMLGMYAHNLFLALFTFFGVIGGILSSLIIIVIILGAFITAKNKKTITVLLIFFSVYFVSSMVSGDILNNYGPWILIGMSLSVVTTRINFHFI